MGTESAHENQHPVRPYSATLTSSWVIRRVCSKKGALVGCSVGAFGEIIGHTSMPPRLLLGALAVVLLGTAACSPCSDGREFSLSLVKDSGGESSPVTAAEWFAVHGGVWSDIPTTGWHLIGNPGSTTDVRSGSMTLQVLQGTDGTWQVESGSAPGC